MMITRRSPLSGELHTLDLPVTAEAMAELEGPRIERRLIQEIFPHLSNPEREFLLTGYSLEEQKTLFAPPSDEPPEADPSTLLNAIVALLDGEEWDADTTEAIANILTDAGYIIRPPGEGDDDDIEDHDGRCSNPAGHKWNRTMGEADEARISGDYANDNIRCVYCGADGDA